MVGPRTSASVLSRLGVLACLLLAIGGIYDAAPAVASQGPVAAYSFDEGEGTTAPC